MAKTKSEKPVQLVEAGSGVGTKLFIELQYLRGLIGGSSLDTYQSKGRLTKNEKDAIKSKKS